MTPPRFRTVIFDCDSTLSTVEPLCTVVLAALLLDESIAPVQLAGGALILAAALLIARARGA